MLSNLEIIEFKNPLTAKLDLAYGLVQFFSSNYFQIGQACSAITYKNDVPFMKYLQHFTETQ
jgi:hypothetical protein